MYLKVLFKIDNAEFGWGIFIDLKKAFDTVNHAIVLLKLHHYGVGGKAYAWFLNLTFPTENNFCVLMIIPYL